MRNSQRVDRPYSVRIPNKKHAEYKNLSGLSRKTIQYKVAKYICKLINQEVKNDNKMY